MNIFSNSILDDVSDTQAFDIVKIYVSYLIISMIFGTVCFAVLDTHIAIVLLLLLSSVTIMLTHIFTYIHNSHLRYEKIRLCDFVALSAKIEQPNVETDEHLNASEAVIRHLESTSPTDADNTNILQKTQAYILNLALLCLFQITIIALSAFAGLNAKQSINDIISYALKL